MEKELYDLFDEIYKVYEACIVRHFIPIEDFIDVRKAILTGEILDEKVYKSDREEP